MTNNKYLTPILTIVIIGFGFFQTSVSDGMFTTTEQFQLAALVVGAIVTYVSPLVAGKWPAVLKVGGAVLGAVLAAIIGLLTSGSAFDTNTISIIVLAGLQALAAQTGADARVDAAVSIVNNPVVDNSVASSVDPAATKIAYARAA